MSAPLRVLLVAGEASGDMHGAALVRALRERVSDIEVAGVGGPRLRAAGLHVLEDTEHVATMGFVETFGTLGRLLRTYRRLVRYLDEERPRLVVLIDYPEFNLRLAAQAKRRGIPVFYFIAPQVWAWRRGRVRKIKEMVKRLALVFPFEPALYNGEEHVADFVGHPLLDVVTTSRSTEETRERHGLSLEAPVVALLPGSREKEVEFLLPAMIAAAERLAAEGWQPIVALAPNLEPGFLDLVLGRPMTFPVVRGDTYDIVASADAVVVASGTASLETALLARPMVIVYRVAMLTYLVARLLVRLRHIGIPNIILGRTVFPELIQGAVSAEKIAAAVKRVAADPLAIGAALRELREKLGEPGAAHRAAQMALDLIP
jgi:lipid-A-disaccharide synthase